MPTERDPERALRDAVAVALDRDMTALTDVRHEQLEYDAFFAHRAVNSVRGSATVNGGQVGWTLVEKRTEGPHLAAPYLLDNAGGSSTRTRPGSSTTSPRASARPPLGTLLEPDGAIALWLEEVPHQGPRPLAAEAILAAANDLGGLSGRWLSRQLEEPWYFRGWIDRHGRPEAVDIAPSDVRRGFDAAIALRRKLAVDVVAGLETGGVPAARQPARGATRGGDGRTGPARRHPARISGPRARSGRRKPAENSQPVGGFRRID